MEVFGKIGAIYVILLATMAAGTVLLTLILTVFHVTAVQLLKAVPTVAKLALFSLRLLFLIGAVALSSLGAWYLIGYGVPGTLGLDWRVVPAVLALLSIPVLLRVLRVAWLHLMQRL